jgi:hypothetical protein
MMVDIRLQLRRARLPGSRDVEVPDRHPREERLQGQRGIAGIPDGVGGDVGIGQAGDRARLRHRRHPAGVAEAGRRLSRSDHRRRARPRRRPQLRHAAEHHAAIAVKKIMEREQLPGTIMLWPGVAEGAVGTKAYFVRAACSRTSTSCCSRTSATTSASWGDRRRHRPGLGRVHVQGRERARAGAPWRGRSALDAVELMDIGWNFRREHLRCQQRSHYVITNGGDQPNVVPRNASGLVLLPRDRSRAHQGAVGDRRQDGRRRGDDDRHEVTRASSARRGRSTSTRPSPRRCTKHQEGRPADVERGIRRSPRRCRRS